MDVTTLILLTAVGLPPVAESTIKSDCMAELRLPMSPPDKRLNRDERARLRTIIARGEALGAAFLETESVWREAGYEPDDFAGAGRSWIGILREGEALVGVYRRDGPKLVREDLVGTSGLDAPATTRDRRGGARARADYLFREPRRAGCGPR